MKGIELINSIESELKSEFMSGAYAWIDKNKNNAFTILTERLDNAILSLQKNGQLEFYKSELEFYKNSMKELLCEYKKIKKINDVDGFMDSLRYSYGEKNER